MRMFIPNLFYTAPQGAAIASKCFAAAFLVVPAWRSLYIVWQRDPTGEIPPVTVHVAHNRANALEQILSQVTGTVDLDYESGWEDALELGRVGQKYGVAVQFRTLEHIAVRSPEALAQGLRAPKNTFRQRYLYCLFDLTLMTDALLTELEARAIEHGDYILGGHLLKKATLVWE